jgi:hypothetical protein
MGGLVMVGKWYKYIGKSYNRYTDGKWYECVGDINDDGAFVDNEGKRNGFCENNERYFDLSNPMDYNPDEVKEEETKPNFKVDTITIVVYPDGTYSANSPLDLKEMVKHIKESAYLLDKQINENT